MFFFLLSLELEERSLELEERCLGWLFTLSSHPFLLKLMLYFPSLKKSHKLTREYFWHATSF